MANRGIPAVVVARGARVAAAASPAGAVATRLLGALRYFATRQPLGAIGAVIVLVLVATAVLAPRLAPHGAKDADFARHLPPSAEFPMGTDHLGRDVLSRVMVGSRDVLIVAPFAALIGVTAGTLLGLIMGYYQG